MRKKIVISIVYILLFVSCKKENMFDCFTSNGKTNVIYHDVKDFNSIYITDKMDLYLTQGPDFEVKVEAGSNMQRLIKVELEGETLRIDNQNTCNFVRGYDHKINVYVTAPYFKYIKHGGLGTIQTTNTIVQDELTYRNESSGDLKLNVNIGTILGSSHGNGDTYLSGVTNNFFDDYTGTNYLYASELKITGYVYLHSITIGHTYINAPENGLMDIIIDKAGNIYYKGNPNTIHLTRNDKGDLIKE